MERAAKLTLMLSLSVFLLATSWHLLGGELPQVREARAQAQTFASPYPGPPIAYLEVEGYSGSTPILVAIDAEGYIWRTSPQQGEPYWVRGSAPYFVGEPPVATEGSTIGALKSRIREGQ